MPEVIDARGVQIREAVAVHVHPDLDDPDQLHQIRDGLPQPVAVPDDGPWCGGADPFVIPDDSVAVLVDAASALEEGHRRADRRRHRQGAERAEAVTDGVDGDGRDPLLRQGGSQASESPPPGPDSSLLAAPGTVAEDRHRPPTRGLGPRRQVQVEEHLVDALHHRRPGPGPDRRDELLRGLVVRRNVLAKGDLAHRTGDEAEQTDVNRRRG